MMINVAHDYRLVALSVVLATFAAYAALELAGRLTAARGRPRLFWLIGGSAAMGMGICTMHYVDMFALSLPMPVFYHLPTVLLSLLAAITGSATFLFVVSRPAMVLWQEIAGSVVMGGGSAATHYIGMAAMRCSAVILYDRRFVALSIGQAMAISFIAVLLAFRLRDEKSVSWRKITGALVIGSAIPLMHYTGMWAATFRPSSVALSRTNALGISTVGVVVISAGSFLVLGVAIASSFLNRFLALQKRDLNQVRERELYFQTMAEAVPEMIWTTGPDGLPDFFNKRWCDYTGLSLEQSKDRGRQPALHPDDLATCMAQWEHSLRTGESYEMEYRLRAEDGTFRWFLGRANPIRDAKGKIVKWFGTCTDIEDQKQNLQILEGQILERTMQLADANTRLQEEMSQKDFARAELDRQNDKMMHELTERSDRATLLAKMGEHMQSCISKDEVFAAALGFAPRIFVNRGALALLNPGRNLAEVIGSWADCNLPTPVFETTACWALRTGHPHLVRAGDMTAPCDHAAGIRNTYLCLPIVAQGEALGVLHFQATDAAPELDESELSFKTTFAGQIGLSIANIRLREALRTQSVRDALTGLYNRRFLEETLEREIRRAARSDQSLGILMLDLDHFKSFNDTYGHEAGDAVLRETGACLVKNIRAEDFVCRFGGEEFVVILPTAAVEAARARAERLRSKIKELTVLHQGKSLGMITVSVGVAAFPVYGGSPKELLASADAALYRAKREGRDRVVIAEPPSAAAADQTGRLLTSGH
jgi:diguanylate cyclase (GGDEF)-like protein/PAS domain S-box-containing protein